MAALDFNRLIHMWDPWLNIDSGALAVYAVSRRKYREIASLIMYIRRCVVGESSHPGVGHLFFPKGHSSNLRRLYSHLGKLCMCSEGEIHGIGMEFSGKLIDVCSVVTCPTTRLAAILYTSILTLYYFSSKFLQKLIR